MADFQFVNQLEASQILQAQTDSHAFWGHGLSLPDRMTRLERHLKQAGPNRFRVCGLVDAVGQVVSSAKLYELQLLLTGAVCPAVGIGAVFTPDRCRGEGHATQLLQSIAGHSAASGYQATLLFSDIAPQFYERLGYVAFPASNWISEVKSLPAGPPLTTRIVSPSDVDGLCRMYETSWPREISRPQRDQFRWTFFRELNWASPDLMLLDGQRIVGYLAARKTENFYWVDEYVVAAADEPRLWATIRRLAEEAGASEVRGWRGLNPLAIRFRTQQRDAAVPMIKLLGPTPANLKLDPQLTHFGSLDHF